MKRKIALLLLICSFTAQYAHAQWFDEWFRQKKTQKKYLIEQIAALKVYGEYLKTGYDISQKGLGLIGQIKDGDFGLHSFHFNSLKNVSPAVASDPEVAEIIKTQQYISGYSTNLIRWYNSQSVFNAEEKNYFYRVFNRLEADCSATLDDLESLTRSGTLEMNDEQRLSQISIIAAESMSQLRFVKSFGSGLQSLAAQKNKDLLELKNSRIWYGQN